MMVRAKRIYILMIKVNNLFFFFLSWYFLKEIGIMFSVFLLRYRTQVKVCENSQKLWKHTPNGLCSLC